MSQRLTHEEFLKWAREQERRHERIDGSPIAMPPDDLFQTGLRVEVWAEFDRAIRAAALEWEYEAVSGVLVKVDDDTDDRPSAVVNLVPRLDRDASVAPSPVIVAEVLSPMGNEIDSADKLADYFKVASIQHYHVVRIKKQEVIHYVRRGGEINARAVSSNTIHLKLPGIVIDIAKNYERADQQLEVQRRFTSQ